MEYDFVHRSAQERHNFQILSWKDPVTDIRHSNAGNEKYHILYDDLFVSHNCLRSLITEAAERDFVAYILKTGFTIHLDNLRWRISLTWSASSSWRTRFAKILQHISSVVSWNKGRAPSCPITTASSDLIWKRSSFRLISLKHRSVRNSQCSLGWSLKFLY